MQCSSNFFGLFSTPPYLHDDPDFFFSLFLSCNQSQHLLHKGYANEAITICFGGDLFDDMIKCSTIFQRKTLLAKVLW